MYTCKFLCVCKLSCFRFNTKVSNSRFNVQIVQVFNLKNEIFRNFDLPQKLNGITTTDEFMSQVRTIFSSKLTQFSQSNHKIIPITERIIKILQHMFYGKWVLASIFLYHFIKIKPCSQNLTSLRHQKELIRRAYSCILHDKLPEGIGLQFPYSHKTTARFGNKIRFGREKCARG